MVPARLRFPLPARLASAWRHLLCASLLLAVGARQGVAQLDVRNSETTPYEAVRLIEDVLQGAGVEVLSVTYDGDPKAIGYFRDGSGPVGMDQGVLLTTGYARTVPTGDGADNPSSVAANVKNGSTAYDVDLDTLVDPLASSPTVDTLFDLARFTITFVPKGDKLSLDYVFASEDYQRNVCTEYADAFGLFLSGPGIAGPYENGGENLALVPGTTLPVSINSINAGVIGTAGGANLLNCLGTNGSLLNSAYYRDNAPGTSEPVYNGMTTVLRAEADVQPCATYTLKLVLGDVGDGNYDSGVFFEAKSLRTQSLDLSVESASVDGEIAEGCTEGAFVFRVADPVASNTSINYTVSGTAVPGSDYAPLSGTATIPAGSSEVRVVVNALADGQVEAPESVTVQVSTPTCVDGSATLWIVDPVLAPVTLQSDLTICSTDSVQLDATVANAVTAERAFTNASPAIVSAKQTRSFDLTVSGVTPAQLRDGVIARVCIDVGTNPAGGTDGLDAFLYGPNGNYIELSTDNGGPGAGGYEQVCFTQNAALRIDDPSAVAPVRGTYRPEGDWADLWSDQTNNVNGTWTLQVSNDAPGRVLFFREWSIAFAARYGVTYAWTPATGLSCADCPDPIAKPGATTDYTVVATDSYGCTEADAIRIGVYGEPTAPVVSCSPGYRQLNFSWPTDANADRYEVSLDGGVWQNLDTATNYTATGLGFGQTVSAAVRAIGPCSQAEGSSSCTTLTCSPYTVTASPTAASCAGYADGSVLVSTPGTAAPYTFALDSVSNTTGAFDSLAAGGYTVGVTDANGCTSAVSFTIAEPARTATSIATTAPALCGDPWQAFASASGGAGAPYGFTWSDGQTGPAASFPLAGTYHVYVRDAAGCQVSDSVAIVYPQPLRAAYAVDSISCAGAADARVRVSAADGNGSYTYAVDGGLFGADSTLRNLAPGGHTVTVRDGLGCTADTSFTLVDPAVLTLAATRRDLSCFGSGDGSVRTSVGGGTAPYTYLWDDGSALDTVGQRAAGSYQVTVTDANGCQVLATGTLMQPQALAATLTPTGVRCFGESTGLVRASVTGGRKPYTYSWTTGAATTDSLLTGLPQGSYGVVVTDSAAGCFATANARVEQPPVLAATHTIQPVTCNGSATGETTVLPSGGTPPYTVLWADGISASTRTGLAAGTYTATVSDSNGCSVTHVVTLDEPAPVDLDLRVDPVSCFGYDDGRITTAPTGGAEPYTFLWTGPNGYEFYGSSPTQLPPGTYQLEFRDGNGCRIQRPVDVTQPVAIALAATPGDTICYAAANGGAEVSVTGGTAPFDVLWDNGERGLTAGALVGGPHFVTVADVAGCTFTTTVTVPELPEIRLVLDQTPVTCFADTDGAATVLAARYGTEDRAASGLTYAWELNPAETGPRITGLQGQAIVRVTGTDARGCTASANVQIGEPTPVAARALRERDVRCAGGADGSARLEAGGGVPGYTYAWLDGTSTPGAQQVTDLAAGTYSATISDANGCVDTASVTIAEPTALVAEIELTEVNCFDEASGAAAVAVTGGIRPYRYAWSDGSTGAKAEDLPEGSYAVDVEDANGCVLRELISVTTASQVELIGIADTVSCSGDRDGAIALSASGGTGPYAYAITGVDYNIFPDFRYLESGRYAARARDRSGCTSDTLWLDVVDPEPLAVELGDELSVDLGESVTLEPSVTGAQGAIDYYWSPADSELFSCLECAQPLFTPRNQGVVRVQINDASGCEAEDLVRISVTKTKGVLLPTAFSPNDDGRDDLLLVHGLSGTQVRSFEVFDRWGELVHTDANFPVNSETRGWDGRFRGEYTRPGVYIWKVDVEYAGGRRESVRGHTTLIR